MEGASRHVLIDAAGDYERRADRLDMLCRSPAATYLDAMLPQTVARA